MLPLRIAPLTSLVCLLAAPAHATWTESGEVLISIDVAGVPTAIEAADIEPDDVVVNVRIGTAGSSAAEGVATVSQETGSERRPLGTMGDPQRHGQRAVDLRRRRFSVGSGTRRPPSTECSTS